MGHIWVTPLSPNWTLDFEPAFSPRFSPTLSPRSFFPTRQRFPISNHVTSGSMSPRSNFDPWSAVSHTGSSSGHVIALDQSGASICARWAPFTTSVTGSYKPVYSFTAVKRKKPRHFRSFRASSKVYEREVRMKTMQNMSRQTEFHSGKTCA